MNHADSKGDRSLTYAIEAHFYALALNMITAKAEYTCTNREDRSLPEIARRSSPCDAGQNKEYQALLRKLER